VHPRSLTVRAAEAQRAALDPLFEAWLLSRRGSGRLKLAERLADLDQQILEACHPKQLAFVLDQADRFAALTAGRAGKTTGSRARLVRKALRIPRARLLFIATTKDQGEDLMWGPLKELVERLGIDCTFNETKMRATFRDNGSTIRIVGADDKREVDKLRGRPWHEVIIDEGASYPAQLLQWLIERVIEPRLGDYSGVLGIVGTPGHHLNGMFYDITRRGSEIGRDWDDRADPTKIDPTLLAEDGTWLGWSVHRWNLLDGAPYVRAMANAWRLALLKKQRAKWSDKHPVWLREYLGVWAADESEMMYAFRPHVDEIMVEENPNLTLGMPWNLWKPELDQYGWAVLPRERTDWRHSVGMDMGHGTPFCLQVLGYSPSDLGRDIYQRWEFHQKKMYARKIAELLIGEHLDAGNPTPLSVIGRVGWPDSMVADLANLGDAIVAELGEVYGIPIAVADKKNKPASVELMNGDLIDGRMHVLAKSVLATQMAELQWRVDEHGMLKEPKHGDDACDGVIYPRREIAKMFEPEKPARRPMIERRVDRIEEQEGKDFTPANGFSELLSSTDDANYYDEAGSDWG
jgi:hypothetical protein